MVEITERILTSVGIGEGAEGEDLEMGEEMTAEHDVPISLDD
jgi:hypothetical protein